MYIIITRILENNFLFLYTVHNNNDNDLILAPIIYRHRGVLFFDALKKTTSTTLLHHATLRLREMLRILKAYK